MRKPTVKTKCVANTYAAPDERIIEFMHSGIGGLISFRPDDAGNLQIALYQMDRECRVIVNAAHLMTEVAP